MTNILFQVKHTFTDAASYLRKTFRFLLYIYISIIIIRFFIYLYIIIQIINQWDIYWWDYEIRLIDDIYKYFILHTNNTNICIHAYNYMLIINWWHDKCRLLYIHTRQPLEDLVYWINFLAYFNDQHVWTGWFQCYSIEKWMNIISEKHLDALK